MTDQINGSSDLKAKVKEFFVNRKNIVIRLLYTILFLAVLGIATNIAWVITVFQYIFLLITKNYIKPLRNFSRNFALYLKEVLDYILLVSNKKPFPFNEFPKTETDLEPLDIADIEE
ncbi:MAG: DUF4389 domain-containing protein [Desulforegulaceae bacterium]|nr:DUF4389 domain-containing protein [Desulforegulaceae bacterium]